MNEVLINLGGAGREGGGGVGKIVGCSTLSDSSPSHCWRPQGEQACLAYYPLLPQ